MNEHIAQIAERLKGLREALDLTPAELAARLDIPEAEYLAHERGERDFTFSFLYNASRILRVNLEDLLTGRSPTLTGFTVVRKGKGLKIDRRQGFRYQNMAYHFRDRSAEPFVVEAGYEEEEAGPLRLSTHAGQEFDFVLRGALRMEIDGHAFTLREGDGVYYDSSLGHGMAAADRGGCEFLAVVMRARD